MLQDNEEYILRSEALEITSMVRPNFDYHSLMRQLPSVKHDKTEAEALLIKVCEYVKDTTRRRENDGMPLYYLDEIEGLKEWWTKHKPKSEREIKLEKIICTLDKLRGDETSYQLKEVAKRILEAIEGLQV